MRAILTILTNWYDSLDEEGENVPTMMIAKFKNYIRKLKYNLSEFNLILKKRLECGKEKFIA